MFENTTILECHVLNIFMCSSCTPMNTMSSIPNVLNNIIIWRFKYPALYLFQSKISKYFCAFLSSQGYFFILGRNWISFVPNSLSNTRIPLAPKYLTCMTVKSLIFKFKLTCYSKSSEIFPIPSVKFIL